MKRYPRLKAHYGSKVIRQRFRIFTTRSQNLSFNLRAHTYAYDYNQTRISHLLKQSKSGRDRNR